MKEALVIHPRFYIYGGGELLCLHTCKVLQDMGYHVNLVCDVFDPEAVERIYGMGDVMKKCAHYRVPIFRPFRPLFRKRFLALQKVFYARTIKRALNTLPGEVVFSTQSSIFTMSGRQIYHFLYDIVDLFAYPSPLPQVATYLRANVDNPLRTWGEKRFDGKLPMGGYGIHWRVYYTFLIKLRNILVGDPTPKTFFALSEQVQRELVARGYRNSRTVYPPCRLDFQPRLPKVRRVITVTRIVPQKRLEIFLECARRMSDTYFIIVQRDGPELRAFNPGYSEELFKNVPENVVRVEGAIKDHPELLEESWVYMYCGIEPGIGIAVVEALGAGCTIVTPDIGGGYEVVRASGTGLTFRYDSIDDAERSLRMALSHPYNPEEVRRSSWAFSPEAFRETLEELLS
jgi:glycosyltransferase involved in cell wall biosynthesis